MPDQPTPNAQPQDAPENRLILEWQQHYEARVRMNHDDRASVISHIEAHWGIPLSVLDNLLHECGLLTARIFHANHERAAAENDTRCEIMLRLHGQACQVGWEIASLLRNGFPDAAFARWRTAHELTVLLTFIGMHDQELARRFAAYEAVEHLRFTTAARKAAVENPGDPTQGPNDDYERRVQLRVDELKAQYGNELAGDYGWAVKAVGGSGRTSFEAIEKYVGRSHSRTYYRYASNQIHAGQYGLLRQLGSSGGGRKVIHVGPHPDGLHHAGIACAFELADSSRELLDQFADPASESTADAIESLALWARNAFEKAADDAPTTFGAKGTPHEKPPADEAADDPGV